MKSERRHELQHNLLADSLMVAVERVRPYAGAIVGVLLLIAASAIAWAAWSAHSRGQIAEAWENMPGPLVSNGRQFIAAPLSFIQPELYEKQVISNYPGSTAADWATLFQAESIFINGVDKGRYGSGDRKTALQAFNDALNRYDAILKADHSSDNAHWIMERAMFGKARVQEFLGNVDDALDTYQHLASAYPKGEYKELADQRIEELQLADVRQFYDLYRTSKPKESPQSQLNNLTLPEFPAEVKGPVSGSGALSGSGAMSGSGAVAPSSGTAGASAKPLDIPEMPHASKAPPAGTASPAGSASGTGPSPSASGALSTAGSGASK